MITAADLAAMRDTCEDTFDSTAVIKGGTVTGDSGGGGTTAWVARGTVDCHLSPLPLGGSENEYADRIVAQERWTITFPAETDVTTDDRIVIGSTSYEVLTVRAPRTWELTRRVEVTDVR